jgi:hypothetical protein
MQHRENAFWRLNGLAIDLQAIGGDMLGWIGKRRTVAGDTAVAYPPNGLAPGRIAAVGKPLVQPFRHRS